MAELDYAFLADYVSLQDGKLTSVGASFTFAAIPSIPAQMTLGIGGRVRAKIDEGPVPIEVKISTPDNSFEMSINGDLEAGPVARPYGDGRVGLLFAINSQIPVATPGLYEFDIWIKGVHQRRLAFEIELTEAS